MERVILLIGGSLLYLLLSIMIIGLASVATVVIVDLHTFDSVYKAIELAQPNSVEMLGGLLIVPESSVCTLTVMLSVLAGIVLTLIAQWVGTIARDCTYLLGR